MHGSKVVELAAELSAADPMACDRDGLAALVARSQRLRGWLDAFDARIALRAADLARDGACDAPGAVLAGGGRRAARDAQAAARRGELCELLPALHGALADGEVSAGHADALARTAGDLGDAGRSQLAELEATLIAKAKASSVELFERQVRDLGRILSRDDGVGWQERLRQRRNVRRWVDRQTGMCHTHLELDPDTDAAVAAAFDAAVAAARAAQSGDDQRTFEQLKADALVELITGSHTSGRISPQVAALIDLNTLRDGLHDNSVAESADGLPLPPETVRRRCCDAALIPVVLNGAGVVDVGRAARVATREQRQALRAMYRTCGYPDCTVRFADCDIHHVAAWEHGGGTDLANLLPLCSRHHHLVHEGGWRLALRPDRTITLRRPDGTIAHSGTTIDVAPGGTASRPPPEPAPTNEYDDPDEPEPDDLDEATITALIRARVRALGPPVRAPAA